MKKLLMLLCFVLIFSGVSFAGTYSPKIYPSAKLTEDSIVLSDKGAWRGVLILPDGDTTCTVKIYDHASGAEGSPIWEHTVDSGSLDSKGVMLPFMFYVDNGIYADVTTLGTCSFYVFFNTFIP